jgi:hypothetical protein
MAGAYNLFLSHSRFSKTSSLHLHLLRLLAASMIVSTNQHRRVAKLVGAALTLVTLGFLLPFFSGTRVLLSLKPSQSQLQSPSPARPLSAGNATLGFQTIQVINLLRRHDRADTLVLQSHISNLSLHITPGVEISDISDNYGLPPNSNKGSLKESEKACFRAHANVRMLCLLFLSLLLEHSDPRCC